MGNLCGFKQNPALKNQIQYKPSEPPAPMNFNFPYSQNPSIHVTPGHSLPPNIVSLNNQAGGMSPILPPNIVNLNNQAGGVSPMSRASMRGSMRKSIGDGDPSNLRNSRSSRHTPDIIKELFEPGAVAPKGTEEEEEGKFKTLFKKKADKSPQKQTPKDANAVNEELSTKTVTTPSLNNPVSNPDVNINPTGPTSAYAFGHPVTPQKVSPVNAVVPAASPIINVFPPSSYSPSPFENRVLFSQNPNQPHYPPIGAQPILSPFALNSLQPFDYSPVQRNLNFQEQPWQQSNMQFQSPNWGLNPNGFGNYHQLR